MKRAILVAALCLACSASAGSRRLLQNVLVVPKCRKPPVIDGKIRADEWRRAAAVTGFQHIFGWMTERQPVVYVTYDDRRFYVAFDSRFPRDSKLRRVARVRDHKRVCADDAIEIWLAPDFARKDELEYQLLGNSLGVIQDILYRRNIGNRLMGWNGNWDFKCTSEPGRWQSEVAISLKELNLETDRAFGLNLCRDYAKFSFTAWTSSRFNNYAHATFGGQGAPAVQLLGLGSIRQADMRARVRVAAGAAPARILLRAEVRLEEDGSTVATAEQSVSAGRNKTGEAILACNWSAKEPPVVPFKGRQEGAEWVNWVRKRRKIVKLAAIDETTDTELMRHQFFLKEGLTDPVQTEKPRAFEVFADMYPSFSILRAGADVYDFAQKESVKRIAVTLRQSGRTFAVGCGFIDSFKLAYGETHVHHLPLNDGSYEAVFDALNAGDGVLATETVPFEKKSFPWQGTHAGVSDDVIFPFTPLEVKGNRSVLCWGREYRFAAHGLPDYAMTRNANIMSAPMSLNGKANGKGFVVKPTGQLQVLDAKPGIVRLRGYGKGPGLLTETNVEIEYDGMMKFHVRLRPNPSALIGPFSLMIPLRDENARLYHACGESIRMTNRSGYVPKGEGVVWTSKEVPNSMVRGTFIPYFWLGDYDRGFCWMADSDREWSVDDSKPTVELIRKGKTLTARVNFFTKSKVLREPVDIVFALMAGPPRPEPKGWRLANIPGNPALPGDRLKLRWFYHAKTFQGFGKPPDMKKYVAAVQTWRERFGESPSVNMSPNDLWGRTEDNLYYEAEWYPGYPSKVRNDYVMYNLDALMKKGYITGLYADDVYPRASNDVVTGSGHVRDDGKVQAGYSMFALRDFFKRAAVLFRKNRCKHGMLLHMTDSMIMPAYCFWDGKHDNEWSRQIGEGHDHIDAYPLGEICARSMSRQYGMSASWHTVAPGHGDDLACLLLLHDIIGRVDSMDNRTLPAKLLFGLDADDVEFLGYWVLQPDTDPEDKGLRISAWVRRAQKTALLTVANLGDEEWAGPVSLPLRAMGLPSNAVAVDGEENHPRLPLRRGRLTIGAPRHNYRIVLVGPPGQFPADEPVPGATLPAPKAILRDDFNRRELGPEWKLACSPVGQGEIDVYRNRLCVRGRDYKFAAAERKLDMDNVRAQVRVERRIKAHQNRVGLALMWPNGDCVFAGPDVKRKQFRYAAFIRDQRPKQKYGSPIDANRPGNMHQFNWVRIDVTPDLITFYGSSDGKTWTEDWQLKRSVEMAGPVALLRLGKNPDGNDDRHLPPGTYNYFDDLVVGSTDGL